MDAQQVFGELRLTAAEGPASNEGRVWRLFKFEATLILPMFGSVYSWCVAWMLAFGCVGARLPANAPVSWDGRPSVDEGMWTFDHFPIDRVEKAYGVRIDQQWLDHVQAASVRLSVGCSASIVSPDGLVITAHHCVSPCLQALSSAAADYMRDGFAATRRREERVCPGLAADVLLSITDVTDQVRGAGSGTASERGREQLIAELERTACAKSSTLHCELVDLYGGGQYKLYKYRRFTDVRVVFAPEAAIAAFGGYVDNFNFPRYAFDVGFVRLYDDERPAQTSRHLALSLKQSADGEPVFMSSSPAGTSRDLTVVELETQRDIRLPVVVTEIAELRGRMDRFSEENAENKRVAAEPLASVGNVLKYMEASQLTLHNRALLDKKRAAEAALRERIARDPKLSASIGDAWKVVAKSQAAYAEYYVRYRMLELNAGSGSSLFRYAIRLVRAADERALLSEARLPEYADRHLPSIERQLLVDRPADSGLERLFLEFWLSKTREDLGLDDPATVALLGKESPDELAARAIKKTRLAEPAFRKALWDGGKASVESSDDPLIRLARNLDPAARAVRKIWETEVAEPTKAAAARIAAARFAVFADVLYPNGSRTPRLSYGKVSGWTAGGRAVSSATTVAGIYSRATGSEPFRLPSRWVAARNKLKPNTVLNFVSTVDAAPGSSGAPLLTADAKLLGIQFDGNIYATGGEYGYDGRLSRMIALSAGAVMEVLTKVYGAASLVKELQ